VPQVPPVPKRHREVPKKTNLKETSVAWWNLVAQKIVRFNLCWEIAGMLCGQWEMSCALGSIDLSSWSICLTGQTGFRRFTQTSDKKIKKWNQQSHRALVSKKALAVMLRPAIAAGWQNPAEMETQSVQGISGSNHQGLKMSNRYNDTDAPKCAQPLRSREHVEGARGPGLWRVIRSLLAVNC